MAEKIKTSLDAKHWHNVSIDDDGNGKTTSTEGDFEDHVHEIVQGEIKPSEGHGHDLVEETRDDDDEKGKNNKGNKDNDKDHDESIKASNVIAKIKAVMAE